MSGIDEEIEKPLGVIARLRQGSGMSPDELDDDAERVRSEASNESALQQGHFGPLSRRT